MKIAFVDDFELVVVDGDSAIPIGQLLDDNFGTPQDRLGRLITEFESLRPKLEAAVKEGGGKALSEVRLRAPVPRPTQFLCAMVNYKEELGPNGPAVDARAFHYEPELALVIGRPGHNSERRRPARAFGYTIVIDASARGVGNAFYRHKSQRTFGPVGPWIVTADEIPDPPAPPDPALGQRRGPPGLQHRHDAASDRPVGRGRGGDRRHQDRRPHRHRHVP
jgi:2-keto-4-pentenoate hydratase/2-oxohepta-3-ene-1,7-dioic acid hydratase in catechol pathway